MKIGRHRKTKKRLPPQRTPRTESPNPDHTHLKSSPDKRHPD